MPEFKKVKTFLHNDVSITRVAGVSYDPVVGQLVAIPDGSADVTFYNVYSAPVRGVVTIMDKAEATKMANDADSENDMSFKVESELDADYTVTFAGVVTGPLRGTNFNLGGSGPWQVEFGAATVSEPVADA